MPMRKPYSPMGQTSAASAAGGPGMPGMGMPPQLGRTGPQLPMPMAGNSRPSVGGLEEPRPELPLPMGPGGPTSPMNAQAQGMLQPKRMPMESADIFGGAEGSMGAGADAGAAGVGAGAGAQAGPGQMEPQVMMRLMRMLGRA